MTDAYATVKVLAGEQRRRTVRLVVNQTSAHGEGRTVRNQLQLVVDRFVTPQARLDGGEAVTLEFVGEVPTDPMVREAVQKRSLLLESAPGSAAGRALMQIAEKLGA